MRVRAGVAGKGEVDCCILREFNWIGNYMRYIQLEQCPKRVPQKRCHMRLE